MEHAEYNADRAQSKSENNSSIHPLEYHLGIEVNPLIVLQKIRRFAHDDCFWRFFVDGAPVLTIGSETFVDHDKLRGKWKRATGWFPYPPGSWSAYVAWLGPILGRCEDVYQ